MQYKKVYSKLLQILLQYKKILLSEPDKHLVNTASEESLNRMIVVVILFFLSFSILAVRMINVMALSGERQQFVKNYTDPSAFERKEIVDRNGTILAVNLNTASLYANPALIFDAKETAYKLHKILPDLDYQLLHGKLSSEKSFVWVKRNITPKAQYAINRLGIPGLKFEREEKRIYPHGSLFSHVMGYVGVDGEGLSGIEKFFDKELKESSSPYKKFQLTLDVGVQNVVREELLNAVNKFRAEGGVGIVLDAKTSEVISLVSLPDFNLNSIKYATSEQLFNRATRGVYELGSVFKVFSLAMALESNVTKLNDVYYVKEPIKISRFKIKDVRMRHTWLSVPEIFMYSSNIGVARMSTEMGSELQRKYISRFNLDKVLDIELPERAEPIVPDINNWGKLKSMTISFGHGIAVTPLHLASTTAAMVNGGYYNSPTLIKNNKTRMTERVISSKTSESVRKLMYMAAHYGAGRRATVPGYFVGGKTGSGEKAKAGGYSKNAKLSSFIAAFPMDDPKYVIYVMLDDPKPYGNIRSATGSLSAAPLTRDIITRIGPILKIKPRFDEMGEIKKSLKLEYKVDESLKTLKSF